MALPGVKGLRKETGSVHSHYDVGQVGISSTRFCCAIRKQQS